MQELNGEKVDIVRYNDDPELYVRAALQPAEPTTMRVDEDAHAIYATVPAEKLSLAIGRGGQNVRLATKLTGWRISITADAVPASVEDDAQLFENKREEMVHQLARDFEVTTVVAEKLFDCGFHSPEGVLHAEPAYFQTTTGLDEATVKEIYDHAQTIVDAKGE